MNTFEKCLYFLQGKMELPKSYGWFHLIFIALVIGAALFLCLKFKNCKEKTVNRILLIAWIILIIGETLKQLLFSFSFDGTAAVWHYQWYVFPYQLCGTPFVVMPFIIFTKEGKLRNACLAFIATFSLFGGLATFFYPRDVFTSGIAINIQTMIHHGTQVVIGIFIAVHNRYKLTFKYYIGAVCTFLVLTSAALAMDIGMYHYLRSVGSSEVFNMFFISPYYPCTLPLLSTIYPKVPYPAFLAIYIVGFMIIGAIMHYGAKGIFYPMLRRAKKNGQIANDGGEAKKEEESCTEFSQSGK